MRRLAAKLVLGFMCFLFIGFGSFIYYAYEKLPTLAEAPKAPVLGVPPISEESAQPLHAYTGLHPRISGRPAEVFSFPISLGEVGPVEPLFAGPNTYPFLCGRNRHTERQPLIDNQQGWGVPVFKEIDGVQTNDVIGYSKDCSQPTTASYYYNRKGTQDFYPLEDFADDEIERIIVDGKQVDFIVRLESGTINRFHYEFAVLAQPGDELARPLGGLWNKRLIYQFRGGVGIGKRQGKIRPNDVLERRYDQIKQGYAVAYSTANQTSNHYNMWLAEDTALRVKKQFISLYGEPLYTVGIGGSGGAIQQYLFAQNNPDLLNAAIALYAYPDMITQTIHVMDCEPLEYYFDVVDAANERWKDWRQRSNVEGMNADPQADNRFTQVAGIATLLQGRWPTFAKGASECIKGWRGLTPLVHNPNFVHFINSFAPAVASNVQWTHWDDLKEFYGVGANGYANSTWDNVGVQYGLQALVSGQLSPEEFLDMNAKVGGWKSAAEMQPEKLWVLGGDFYPVDLSFWSHHNMYHSGDNGETPARRSRGSVDAIAGAYRSGHVFIGYADIPIIDVRHYLDDDLDMHHATASFSTRLRFLQGQGYADNQLIWMSDKHYNPQDEAFTLIDRWLENQRRHPERNIVQNKPVDAQDQCFDADGSVIAAGADVWDGDWNNRRPGACMQHFPRHATSREVAGGGVSGDIFKCHLQPVQRAIANGVYGSVDMSPYQARLEHIFPEGVCDYRRGDVARPNDLMQPSHLMAKESDPQPMTVEPVTTEQEPNKNVLENVNITTLEQNTKL